MSGLYVSGGGVNRKLKKLYTNVGGVNREIKELWARDSGGVNRKIFSNAITWTYTVEIPYSPDETDCWPSDSVSCHLEYSGGYQGYAVEGIVTYIFTEPFVMRAGQTINGLFNPAGYRITYHYVYLNNSDTPIFDEDVNADADATSLYTFPSDISITTIKCKIHFTSSFSNWANMVITINSDIGSFALNNSGTSEGQV